MNSFRAGNLDLSAFRNNWFWFFLWGLALLLLGIFAIGASTMTTLITVVFLGILIFISGIVLLVDSFTFWWHRWKGFLIHFLIGILYTLVGLSLMFYPVTSSISLTLFLGIFYLIVALFRIFYSLSFRSPQWGWVLFSGIVTLLLSVFILMSWPYSGMFIIGLFVGIDLIFSGWAYIIAALSARTFVNP